MADMHVVRRGTPPPPPWGDDIPYYWEGEENESVTGGWELHFSEGTFDFQKNIDNIFVAQNSPSSGTHRAQCGIGNKIDLTNVNTIRMLCDIEKDPPTNFALGVIENKSTRADHGVASTQFLDAESKVDFEVSVDVSGVNGEYYIGVLVAAGGGTGYRSEGKIKKVWGEV